MAMHRVSLTITFLFLPIYLVAMDRPQESGPSSIIALDIFDNKFTTPPAPERFLRESALFARSAIEENPLNVNKKLFQHCLRRSDAEEAFFIVQNSRILREHCSLAKKMWDVDWNRSIGFELVPIEDYEEEVLPRECIVKTFLLLACTKKNRNFLSEYQRTYGMVSLHAIIGNSLYEQMYGAIALKNVIGVNAYKKFKQGEKIKVQLQRMEELFSNDETENW